MTNTEAPETIAFLALPLLGGSVVQSKGAIVGFLHRTCVENQ